MMTSLPDKQLHITILNPYSKPNVKFSKFKPKRCLHHGVLQRHIQSHRIDAHIGLLLMISSLELVMQVQNYCFAPHTKSRSRANHPTVYREPYEHRQSLPSLTQAIAITTHNSSSSTNGHVPLEFLRVLRTVLYPNVYLPLFMTRASLLLMLSWVFFCGFTDQKRHRQQKRINFHLEHSNTSHNTPVNAKKPTKSTEMVLFLSDTNRRHGERKREVQRRHRERERGRESYYGLLGGHHG